MNLAISNEDKTFIKLVTKISTPIILQELINTCINLIDTLMIGKIGENELTAVSLANQIFFVFILLTFGCVSGGSVLISQYWGQKDKVNIQRTLGLMFVVSFMSACIFGIPAMVCPEKLIGFYTNSPEIIALGSSYLRVVSLSYFIVSFTLPITASLKSIGMTIVPMFGSVIALIANVTLNYYFIFVLKEGVVGAAKATVLARMVEIVTYVTIIYVNKLPILGPFKNYIYFKKDFVKKYWNNAWPVILNELGWVMGVTLYVVAYGKIGLDENGMSTVAGTRAQAAAQITSSVRNLFMIFGIGLGVSAGIIIGNLLGANNIDLAIKYSRKYLKLVCVVGVIMAIALFVSAPEIVGFFNVSEYVKEDAAKTLKLMSFFIPINLVNFLTIVGILRCGGDTKFCMLVDMGAVWLVGVPVAFISVLYFKLPIYYVVPLIMLEEVAKVVFTLPRLLSNKWAKNIIN